MSGHLLPGSGACRSTRIPIDGTAASKFGVVGLIRSLALEHQRQGVRYSLFYLGGVDSPFWDHVSMNPQRDKMIPLTTARDAVLSAIDLPAHLVPAEITIQPESHQLV